VAASNPPTRAEAFEFAITVADMANPGKFKTDPTIAAGDFKISKDWGATANLGTLPDIEPAGSPQIRVLLSGTEMTADQVMIIWEDQTSPPEWASGSICILTTA
jgi:hypothetical protein